MNLAKTESVPAVNECLICARCAATFRVLHHVDNGRGVQLWPSNDRECDTHAEMPWCPNCGRAGEREKGLRFNRNVPTRVQLRAALKEALDGWSLRFEESTSDIGEYARAKYASAIEAERAQIAELRKLVAP